MSNRVILAVAAAFAMSFVTMGASSATAAVCDPHCSVKGSKGLQRAEDRAGDHGKKGRHRAAEKQGVVLVGSHDDDDAVRTSGGTTVVTADQVVNQPAPPPATDPLAPPPVIDPLATTTTTANPCSGC